MQLFRYKPLGVGFVVLCPDKNPAALRITVNGIKNRYRGANVIVSVPEDIHPEDLEAIGKVCGAYKGGNTITSLINAGLNHASDGWNLVVISGSHVRQGLDRKLSYFVEEITDILFPIAEGRANFVDGSINGILIHRDTWKMVGGFCNEKPLDICKTLWATEAIEKGCTFKAVIGAQIL